MIYKSLKKNSLLSNDTYIHDIQENWFRFSWGTLYTSHNDYDHYNDYHNYSQFLVLFPQVSLLLVIMIILFSENLSYLPSYFIFMRIKLIGLFGYAFRQSCQLLPKLAIVNCCTHTQKSPYHQ